MKRTPKNEPLEVIMEYTPTADAEDRLLRIFEFLLQDQLEEKTLLAEVK